MSPARKKTTKKSTARKATKKTTSARKSPKRSPARKTAKKPTARKAIKKTSARKSAKKSTKKPARKTTRKVAKKTSAKKATKKTSAKRPARKATAKKTATRPAPKRSAAKKAPVRKPAAKKATRRPATPKPHNFDRKTLDRIRGQLRGELEGLERQQAELDDSSDVSQSDMASEMGVDEDFADAGTATFDRERDFSIRNNISDLIGQVTRALEKIDEGTYGSCEHCGRPINSARLQALPHALLCMDCKRRDERSR
jgi:RNA polymerase-binding protein DksA